MVNLTISLSDETVRRLRKTVHDRYGGKKGALSGLIEESVRDRLEAFDTVKPSQTFKAMKDNRIVAQAENLDGLARRLAQNKIDPRSVIIISSRELSPVVRIGPRGRKT